MLPARNGIVAACHEVSARLMEMIRPLLARHTQSMVFVIFPCRLHGLSTFRTHHEHEKAARSPAVVNRQPRGEAITVDNGSQLALIPAMRNHSETLWNQTAPRAQMGAPTSSTRPAVLPRDRERLQHTLAEAYTALEDAAVTAAVAAQRARALAVMLEKTLAALQESAPASVLEPALAKAPGPDTPLSQREKEVLALVAEGRTNKAIAEALFVSPNTVKTHVASLLHKLGADSRVQLAALATRRGFRHPAATAAT